MLWNSLCMCTQSRCKPPNSNEVFNPTYGSICRSYTYTFFATPLHSAELRNKELCSVVLWIQLLQSHFLLFDNTVLDFPIFHHTLKIFIIEIYGNVKKKYCELIMNSIGLSFWLLGKQCSIFQLWGKKPVLPKIIILAF